MSIQAISDILKYYSNEITNNGFFSWVYYSVSQRRNCYGLFCLSNWSFSVILQDRQSSRIPIIFSTGVSTSILFKYLFNLFLKIIHLDKRLQSCDFTEELSEIITLFLTETLLESFHRCCRRYIHVRVPSPWRLALFSL